MRVIKVLNKKNYEECIKVVNSFLKIKIQFILHLFKLQQHHTFINFDYTFDIIN